MVNLLHNVPIAAVGETRNPYREWIGALIRADVYGWALPDQPGAAARLVFSGRLAVTSQQRHLCRHVGGRPGLGCLRRPATVAEAVERSLDYVPARSRLAEALGLVTSSIAPVIPGSRRWRGSVPVSATTAGCTRSTMLA